MLVKRYEFAFGRFGTILDDSGNEQEVRLADAEDEISECSPSQHIWMLVEAEQDKHPQLDQKTAVERVRKKNPKLFQLYASESGGMLRVY